MFGISKRNPGAGGFHYQRLRSNVLSHAGFFGVWDSHRLWVSLLSVWTLLTVYVFFPAKKSRLVTAAAVVSAGMRFYCRLLGTFSWKYQHRIRAVRFVWFFCAWIRIVAILFRVFVRNYRATVNDKGYNTQSHRRDSFSRVALVSFLVSLLVLPLRLSMILSIIVARLSVRLELPT